MPHGRWVLHLMFEPKLLTTLRRAFLPARQKWTANSCFFQDQLEALTSRSHLMRHAKLFGIRSLRLDEPSNKTKILSKSQRTLRFHAPVQLQSFCLERAEMEGQIGSWKENPSPMVLGKTNSWTKRAKVSKRRVSGNQPSRPESRRLRRRAAPDRPLGWALCTVSLQNFGGIG